jgi:hypothetical protein
MALLIDVDLPIMLFPDQNKGMFLFMADFVAK